MAEELLRLLPRLALVMLTARCIGAVSGSDRDVDGLRLISLKKRAAILTAGLLVAAAALTVRELILRRAEYHGGLLEFDGLVYAEVSFSEAEPYTETWNALCRTADGRWTVYELAEYPGREFVAARLGHEGRLLKLVS